MAEHGEESEPVAAAGAVPAAGWSPAAESSPAAGPAPTSSGPGRVLVAVYGIFALAATSRAGVQLATDFHTAPIAYLLSAFSGLVYIVATVALARGGHAGRLVATVSCSVELVGVIAVGTISYLLPDDFPRATVWTGYGSGYGYVPLVLPIIGLWWLRRTARTAAPVR